MPTKSAKAIYRFSKPLPGSITPDGVVVWRPKGKAAALDVDIGVEDLEPRALASTGMDALIRALAYATLVYWIRTYLDGLTNWDASLTRILGGWIAKCEVEGRGINAEGKSLEGAMLVPYRHARGRALDLIEFLGKLGANNDLKLAYLQAEAAADPRSARSGRGLARHRRLICKRRQEGNSLRLQGRPRPHRDRTHERAVSPRRISTNVYLDRDLLLQGLPYEKKHDDLAHRHNNESVLSGKKRGSIRFGSYAMSNLRTDVSTADMFPGEEPAAIIRISPVHGIVKIDEILSDEYKAFNIYRGFAIKPTGTVNPDLMRKCVTALDRLLGLLTRDNDAQMDWLKKFIAWTIRPPAIKQQVAPVIIGGQGIGKSVFGNTFMNALFGDLAGVGSAVALEGNFSSLRLSES